METRPRKRGSSQRPEMVGDKQEGEWQLYWIGPHSPCPFAEPDGSSVPGGRKCVLNILRQDNDKYYDLAITAPRSRPSHMTQISLIGGAYNLGLLESSSVSAASTVWATAPGTLIKRDIILPAVLVLVWTYEGTLERRFNIPSQLGRSPKYSQGGE
jgi:hypothetical protein